MKTASIPKINQFMFDNAIKFNNKPDGNDWVYADDIQKVISRKETYLKLCFSIEVI